MSRWDFAGSMGDTFEVDLCMAEERGLVVLGRLGKGDKSYVLCIIEFSALM